MPHLRKLPDAGDHWRLPDRLFHAQPSIPRSSRVIPRAFADLRHPPHLGAATRSAHRPRAKAIVAGDKHRAVAIISGILSDVDEAAIQIARGLHAG